MPARSRYPWLALSRGITVFSVALALCACLSTGVSRRPSYSKPVLDPPVVDLGTIVSGEPAEGRFLLRNTGDATLVVRDLEPSCGCTVTRLERDHLPPGQTALLAFRIDTRGKRGAIEKTIRILTNAPDPPYLTARIVFFASDPVHGDAALDTASLFSGACRRCHAEPARGKLGDSLYRAVCAMCHRSASDDVSPGSPRDVLETISRQEITAALRRGIPGTSMPAFATARGGPLDDDQILSLTDLLGGTP